MEFADAIVQRDKQMSNEKGHGHFGTEESSTQSLFFSGSLHQYLPQAKKHYDVE
jgi:hypothetical protein